MYCQNYATQISQRKKCAGWTHLPLFDPKSVFLNVVDFTIGIQRRYNLISNNFMNLYSTDFVLIFNIENDTRVNVRPK